MANKNQARLELWKERLQRNAAAYAPQLDKMDGREELYNGSTSIRPLTEDDVKRGGQQREARHVRNIVAENIESEINSSIPQPKVTARRKEDERLAKIIEDMIRDELNRLPMEQINDMQERTVPIQGGALYLLEWDSTQRTHSSTGEIVITPVHPKQVIPQDGVYTGIEDMDYIILKIPQTRAYIERRYGVTLEDEAESEPEVKAPAGDNSDHSEDMVTQYVAYYRNDNGGIGLFSWVNDVVLEDLEDHQARRLPRCSSCGALKPPGGVHLIRRRKEEPLAPLVMADQIAGGMPMLMEGMQGVEPVEQVEEVEVSEDVCPYCGGTEFTEGEEAYEELYVPVTRSDGSVISGMQARIDQGGWAYEEPTRIPFYKPDVYPLVLQKNISKFGCFLGDSDVDKIADQQNTINRLSLKIIDKLVKAGTRITLPPNAAIGMSTEDQEFIRLDNIEDRQYIGVYDFTGEIGPDMAYLAQVYEEARQILGITDSWQGRQDSTATSGKAKQYAAAQSAGRLESKRVMKDAAYAQLFELIFKYRLAYADEPRPIVSRDQDGNTVYSEFNRYDFLMEDESGYWWNDQFLFSTDSSAPLANNREQMWENTTAHLQAGAYGDPGRTETLILYWTKMELLHYPGAADTRAYLEKRLEQEQIAAQQQAAMQQQAQQQQLMLQIDQQARQDAQAAAARMGRRQTGPANQIPTAGRRS